LVDVIDVDSLEELVINSRDTPTEVRVRPVVGGQPEELMTLDDFRAEFPLLRSTFTLARELYETTHPAGVQALEVGPMFEEVLDLVTAYVDRRVRVDGSSIKADIGMYFWTRRALDILETAVQGAPGGTTTVPLFGDPEQLESGRIRPFGWTGIIARGRKCHLTRVPCHTDLEREFADFLDNAGDVVRYLKNERLGFSVTYYENNRARQYYPDFIVLVRSGDGTNCWYIAETKGEIRTNTELKRQAAELWCDRMTRSGNGVWRHLFVPQRPFERAVANGSETLTDLAARLATTSAAIMAGTD
jgi:type III restriction enzyme